MSKLMVFLSLAVAGVVAHAGTTYSEVGGAIYKSTDDGSSQQVGDTVKGLKEHKKQPARANAETAQQAGAAQTQDASSDADSKGAPPDMTGGQRIGDSTFRSDGVTCRQVGGSSYCN